MNHSRHMGKIRKRLEDIKNQSMKLTKADFSHNESIRLATDAFLDGGTDSYLETLSKEGEVDFLSSVEAQYIKDNAKESYYAQESLATDGEAAPKQNDAGSLPSGTYFPTISDSSEPALLHTWITAEKPYLKEKSTATVYFQTEKNSNIRDIIRRYINKSTQVLAIVMDVFTDTEILCDLLEAANKRMVFVYLLLDHGNLNLFTEMCDKLQIAEDLFKNISVRSVTGEVYCAKSGRKFSGQIKEKFLISDWKYVLSGSYSFTWLCGQVHRNLLSKFTGQVVELFDEEFRHLYALSKPVRGPTRSPAQTKRPPRTLMCSSSNFGPPSPLHRVNSFHSCISFTPPPLQMATPANYYPPHYMSDNSPALYSNMNLYRPIRVRQEEPNRTGLSSPWRCLHKANLF
ncbi:Protein FAM83A, partial [Calypte anna]